MLRTINRKFYAIVGLTAIMFGISYAEVAYFLNKQSQTATHGQTIVHVDREIRNLLNFFYEMRFWERAVFTQEFSDAEQRFGTLMAGLKAQLAGLQKKSFRGNISQRLGTISKLLWRYEQDFNRLTQVNTEHRLQRTRIDSTYQSVASSLLSLRNPNLLKPLYVLTQFQMNYVDNHRESEYQALQVVIESLRTKLSESETVNERQIDYLETYRKTLQEDVQLNREFIEIFKNFNQTSAELTELLSQITREAEIMLQTEFLRAERIRDRLNETFIVFIAVSFLIMLLVITIIAQKILRPVRSVARVINEVKSGAMESRFNPRGDPKDEVVQLGLTFNEMLDQLENQNRQLVRYQENLENKIKELAVREKERESLIEELEAKNAELERFTYTVSHDLKSPLITIQGFLGFLEKDAVSGDAEQVRADCSRIKAAAKRMQQLLSELLELSRIGRIINPPERISFEEIAREAAGTVFGRMRAGKVRVEIADNLPYLHADRQRLREVLENLLDNAGKYMGSQSDPLIEIGCRNTGEKKVFGLFEKLDSSVEGSGVGLAIVKRIIEVHGGRVWVESEGAESGSTFCFTLPAAIDSNKKEPLADEM